MNGRFSQPDSIIPEQSQGVQAWDRYAYTNNNPVRYTDPTGHWGFEINFNLSVIVNSAINLNPLGITGEDVAKTLDTVATTLDVGAAAISSTVAALDVAAVAIGYTAGAGIALPEGGAPAVVTGPAGAAVGVGLVELNPITRAGGALADGMGLLSTVLAAESDIITGDTNVTSSLSVSSNGVQISQSSSIGRDTLTNSLLSGMGLFSPIGLMDAPLDAVGLLDDFDKIYIGPLAGVPESIKLTDIDFEMKFR